MSARADQPPDDDRRLGERLQRALNAEAAAVQPVGDGLSRIRARTAARSRLRWLVPVAAGTAALALVGGVSWATGVLDRGGTPGVAADVTVSATPDPTSDASPPTVTQTPPSAPVASVPVYYLTAQAQQNAPARYELVREYRRLTLENTEERGARIIAAVQEMFADDPLDDDYFGIWPSTAGVLTVSYPQGDVTGGTITLDVTGLDWSTVRTPDGRFVDSVGATLVQQLVYTVTAAATKINSGDTFAATGVTLLVDGEPVDAILGVDTSGVLKRAPAIDVEAPIWIIGPESDQVLSNPVVVRGIAVLDEGQAQWELRLGGEVVDSGTFQTGECCKRLEYEFTLGDLEPGTYEITLFDVGGRGERAYAASDSKTFIVH